MANSASATAMLSFVQTQTSRLNRGIAFQARPMDNAAIYEAYIFTCVVEALEVLQQKWRAARINWRVVSPPASPNTLVLRKKACSVKSATDKYGYVLLSVNGRAYELHTDVPAEGRSGVLNEIDVVLLKAAACDRIRRGRLKAPTASDVILLIEAKCYSNSLELGIGRGFLGLRNAEFGGQTLGYLVSTADNDHIQTMVAYHGGNRQSFWPNVNDQQANRDALIQEFVWRLSHALLTKSKTTTKAKQNSALQAITQLPLFPPA